MFKIVFFVLADLCFIWLIYKTIVSKAYGLSIISALLLSLLLLLNYNTHKEYSSFINVGINKNTAFNLALNQINEKDIQYLDDNGYTFILEDTEISKETAIAIGYKLTPIRVDLESKTVECYIN